MVGLGWLCRKRIRQFKKKISPKDLHLLRGIRKVIVHLITFYREEEEQCNRKKTVTLPRWPVPPAERQKSVPRTWHRYCVI